MNKLELKDKIKSIVKSRYATKKVNLDDPLSNFQFDTNKFPILSKFPDLKKILVDLLTNQYELFVKEIQWVAPRPTTFKILLLNDQLFYLIFNERSWIAQVEGRKYYLLNLPEEQRAAEAISCLLRFGYKSPDKDETIDDVDNTDTKENKPEEKPEEKPEDLKEIEATQSQTSALNKAFLVNLLGPEKIAKLKSFGANKNRWISIYNKIATELGIDINKFYEANLEEKVRDIIFK